MPGPNPNSSSLPTSSLEHRSGIDKHCDELSPECALELPAAEECSEIGLGEHKKFNEIG